MNIPYEILQKSHQIIFTNKSKTHQSEKVRRIIYDQIRRKCYVCVYEALVYSILESTRCAYRK